VLEIVSGLATACNGLVLVLVHTTVLYDNILKNAKDQHEQIIFLSCLNIAYSLAFSLNFSRTTTSTLNALDTLYIYTSISNSFVQLFPTDDLTQKLYLWMDPIHVNEMNHAFSSNKLYCDIVSYASENNVDFEIDLPSYFNVLDSSSKTPLDATFTNVRAASVVSVYGVTDPSTSISMIVASESRKGFGKGLLVALHSQYAVTMLWCHKENKPAKFFYKSLGYNISESELTPVDIKHRNICISDGEDLSSYMLLTNA